MEAGTWPAAGWCRSRRRGGIAWRGAGARSPGRRWRGGEEALGPCSAGSSSPWRCVAARGKETRGSRGGGVRARLARGLLGLGPWRWLGCGEGWAGLGRLLEKAVLRLTGGPSGRLGGSLPYFFGRKEIEKRKRKRGLEKELRMRVIFPDSQKYARSKKNGVGKIARFKIKCIRIQFKWFEQGVGLQSVQKCSDFWWSSGI